MVIEEHIHFRVSAKFKMQVMEHVRKKKTNLTDYCITSLRHEMYGQTDEGMACSELDLMEEYIAERRTQLSCNNSSSSTSQKTPNTVSQTVSQSTSATQTVSQNSDVSQTVSQKEVDYKQINELDDVYDIPTAVALIRNRQRYSFTESISYVELVADRCGCTLKEFTKVLDENDIPLKWEY
jgi:hypothetical protein